ncbi:MAG: translation initiation factor IF-3 [Planctomycetota bacterium]
MNERIRIKTVRLIDENGQQVGVVTTDEARQMAHERGFDLVEIVPTCTPPVCKIMDYGKYKYEQHKKERQAKHKHHVVHIKELQLSPKIEEHDFQVRIKHARDFIHRGDKVLVTLEFKGREITHKELGVNLMNRFIQSLSDITKVDEPLKSTGRRMAMMLVHK